MTMTFLAQFLTLGFDAGIGEALLIAGIVGAASAGTGAAAANQQNKAVKASGDAARRAGNVALDQSQDAAALEKMKRLNQANAIKGRLAVASAERGIGTGGTAAALQRAEDYNARIDQAIGATNQRAIAGRIESESAAQYASIASRGITPLLAAFSGGLSGFSAGLNIGGAVSGGGGGNPPERPGEPPRYAVEGGSGGAPYGSGYA